MRPFVAWIVLAFPALVSAQTATDAKVMKFDALASAFGTYTVKLTDEQRELLLELPSFASNHADALSKPTVSLSAFTPHLLPKNESIVRAFSKHDDPLVRFFVFYEAGKRGSEEAAASLHQLFREQGSDAQASMLRTFAELRGIMPNTDSAKTISAVLRSYGRKKQTLRPGQLVGDFSVVDSEGNKITRATLGGKVTFIYFWASWCGPCMQQMEALVNKIEQYPAETTVLLVNLDLDTETFVDASRKLKANCIDVKADCIHIHDDERILSRVFGIRGLPHRAWLNPEGKLLDPKSAIDKLRKPASEQDAQQAKKETEKGKQN